MHRMARIALTLGLLAVPGTVQAAATGRIMQLQVGKQTFNVTLDSGAAAQGLRAMLPLTLNMTELNGNEKYADLPRALPVRASNPGTIHAGDVLLYGSKTVVVFYETFSTSYSYTHLGRIENTAGLAQALGKGNVTVTLKAR